MRLLIADNNTAQAEQVRVSMRSSGHVVDVVHDGHAADTALAAGIYDLAMVETTLPGMDGVTILGRLRMRPIDTAFVLMSSLFSPASRCAALDAGADDCIERPVDIAELAARSRAILRRRLGVPSPTIPLGNLVIDLNRGTVDAPGGPIVLPPRAYAILEGLLAGRGRAVEKRALAGKLRRPGSSPSDNSVELHVSRLRRILAPHHVRIQTVRGIGYLIASAT